MLRALVILAAASAWLAFPASAGDLSIDPTAATRKLYLNRCAKCHKLYDPARYSDPQWSKWMDKMSRKAKLQPEQKEALSRYIETTLRRAASAAPAKPVP